MTVAEPTVEGTAHKPPVHTRALIIGTGSPDWAWASRCSGRASIS